MGYNSVADIIPVSATVFSVKDRKLPISATPALFHAPSGGTPLDIDAIYTILKSAFNGLQFRR